MTTATERRRAVLTPLLAPGLILSVLVLLTILGWALLPGAFSPYGPLEGVPADRLQPPSAAHLFGTDQLGRDVFSRVVHGTALSLQASVTAVGLALISGSLLGLTAAYSGGRVDDILMRIVDVLLAIPGLLLSLTVVTALGFGTTTVAVAVGIAGIPAFARLIRAEALRVRSSAYVEVARSLGHSHGYIALRHVLPNSSGPVLSLVTLELGTATLAVAALSFLGFGATPPDPEWGAMISEGRSYLAGQWWLTALPGLVLAAFVIASNRISRELQKHGERTR